MAVEVVHQNLASEASSVQALNLPLFDFQLVYKSFRVKNQL